MFKPIKRQNLLLLLFLLSFAFHTSSVKAETAVLLNKNNSVLSLSLNQVKRIFKGKTKYWNNGEQVVIFLPEVGTLSLDAVIKNVFHKINPSAVSKFYLKAVFQQKFAMPPHITTDPITDISTTKGGITIIDTNEVSTNNTVKILRVDGL